MKRIISVLLVLVMALGMCACSKDTGKDGEIPTLVWYVPGETQADQQVVFDAMNEILVEKLGAKIEVRFISDGSFKEKMRMMMAAREEFDLCFTGYNNPYKDAVENGALYDITDLIEGSALYEQLDQKCFDVAEVDGRIYGIPNQQIFALPHMVVVRKDLAEKYNLDWSNFTKTKDIEPFLQTIKENEPDYIPFSAYHKLNGIWSVDDERYQAYANIDIKEVGENDWEAIKPDYTKENNIGYKKMKVMSDWYKKGYIRADVDTVEDDLAEMAAGKYAVTIDSFKPGVESEIKTKLNSEVVTKIVGPTYFSIDFPLATMISVSATTKHPELAVKFIELINTDVELYNILCYGIEGKHFNKLGENRIELIDDSGYQPNACWKFGNNFNAWLTPLQPDDCHEQSRAINASAKTLGIPGFTFDNDKVKMEVTQIAIVSDKYLGLQIGSIDPDVVWDKYVSEMEKAGIYKCYEEVKRQIDEFEKTLK